MRYYIEMIDGFACKQTERIYNGQFPNKFPNKFPNEIQRIARRKLIYLDEADVIEDLISPPGNRLEKLKRNRKGQWCMRINDQWRICFKWADMNATNVEIVDYH